MTLLQQCDDCGRAFRLILRLPTRWLCADCWHVAGEPSQPAVPPDFEAETKIRERMTASEQ